MSDILAFNWHWSFFFFLCAASFFTSFVEGHNPPSEPTPSDFPTSIPSDLGPPPLRFAPGPDIPIDRFYTVDSDLLTAPASIAGGDCTIPTSSVAPNGSLTLILPPPIPDDNTESFESIHARALNVSMPYFFEQMGVDPDRIPALVSRGIPIFAAAAKESLCQNSTLTRRGLFDPFIDLFNDIFHGAKEAAIDLICGTFAGNALHGYIIVTEFIKGENLANAPRATTPDQDFYIFPLHGAISHKDGIAVTYSAKLPPGFGDTVGVTIGRSIYLRSGVETADSSNPGFSDTTHILLHELTHSKQYQALGYFTPAFGIRYLFNFCKAGFSYKNNIMEVEARNKADLMNQLLFDPIGKQFVSIWKRKGLAATLGLPTARTFMHTGSFSISRFKFDTYSLQMQRGRMSIFCAGTFCV